MALYYSPEGQSCCASNQCVFGSIHALCYIINIYWLFHALQNRVNQATLSLSNWYAFRPIQESLWNPGINYMRKYKRLSKLIESEEAMLCSAKHGRKIFHWWFCQAQHGKEFIKRFLLGTGRMPHLGGGTLGMTLPANMKKRIHPVWYGYVTSHMKFLPFTHVPQLKFFRISTLSNRPVFSDWLYWFGWWHWQVKTCWPAISNMLHICVCCSKRIMSMKWTGMAVKSIKSWWNIDICHYRNDVCPVMVNSFLLTAWLTSFTCA